MMEQPPMENMPHGEKKPILEQISKMNVSQLIAFFAENKNFTIQTFGKRMREENEAGGIAPETFRTALRRVMTKVPSSGETEEILNTIKNKK